MKALACIAVTFLLASCQSSSYRQGSFAAGRGAAPQRAGTSYQPHAGSFYQTPSYRPLAVGTQSYHPDSLSNPYGAGSPYKVDGLMNPYSPYGSKYSNQSWTNPYATNAPKIVDENGKYHGRLSTNKYDPDSISNPYGRYGSKYSPDSLNNPYGAGSPYSGTQFYAVPQQ